MELKQIGNYFIAVQRQGNDKNGNPIYIISVFDQQSTNINWKVNHYRRDKYDNIKMTSYNITADIESIINNLEAE